MASRGAPRLAPGPVLVGRALFQRQPIKRIQSTAVGAITRGETSGKVRRNMPDPIPVMVLDWLAVDANW